MDNRRYLKIKIKNLAEEARIIRFEERKTQGMERWHLQDHRKTVVRDAARRTQFAYGIIRGRTRQQLADKYVPHMMQEHNDLEEVTRMVRKYGSTEQRRDAEELVKTWFKA